MAMSASSVAVGSGTTAQSAWISRSPSAPWKPGIDQTPQLEIVSIPSCMPISVCAARITSVVLWTRPATVQSASPMASIRTAKFSGSRIMRLSVLPGSVELISR